VKEAPEKLPYIGRLDLERLELSFAGTGSIVSPAFLSFSYERER
jgi:hypothetical protein